VCVYGNGLGCGLCLSGTAGSPGARPCRRAASPAASSAAASAAAGGAASFEEAEATHLLLEPLTEYFTGGTPSKNQ